jgi:hypothetical protein
MATIQIPHWTGHTRCELRTPLSLNRADSQKNKNLRTVVNKLNNIHAQYRYFDMEVLAGDKDFITQVVSLLPAGT